MRQTLLTKTGANTQINVTINGLGAEVFTGVNTYTGSTSISAGTLQIAGGGLLGGGTYATGIAIGSGAALSYTGSAAQTFSGAISGSGSLALGGPGQLTLSPAGGNPNFNGTATVSGGTLVVNAGNTAAGALGATSLITVNSGGTIIVGSNNNAFQGTAPLAATQINAGSLVMDPNTPGSTNHLGSLTLNGGTLSAVSANSTWGNWNFDHGVSTPGDGSASTIAGGNATLTQVGGTVFNIGAGDTLDVSAALALTTSGADNGLIKTGAGLLVLSSPSNSYTSATTISAGTLQLGNGGSSGNLAGGSITNNSVLAFGRSDNGLTISVGITGSGSVAQIGSGITTLSGNSTYTGSTTVAAGTLRILGTLMGTNVNVGNGAGLSGAGDGFSTGVITGTVTVKGGGAIDFTKNGLLPGSTTTLAAGGLVLGDFSANSANLTFDVNTTNAQPADLINLGGGNLTVNPSNAMVSIASTTLSPGTYNLISYGTFSGAGSFALNPADTHIGLSTLSLSNAGNALELIVSGNPIPTLAYWSGRYNANGGNANWGGFNSSGPVTNFSLNAAGTTDAGQLVGGVTDVVFAAASAPGSINSTLDDSFAINSLTVTTNGAVSISGSQTLTINAAASGAGGLGYSAGTGIVMQSGAVVLTISASTLVAAASQSWANSSTSSLALSGNLTGSATAGNTTTVTLAGNGSGGAVLSGAVGDGGGGGNLALAVNMPNAVVALSGSNTFSGGTTLSSGTVTAGGNSPLGTGTVTINPSSGTAVLALTGAAPLIGSLSSNGGGASLVLLGNAGGGGSATTLTVGTNNASATFAGAIGDLSLANSAARGSLVKTGTGMQILAGNSTFTAGTTVSAGTLVAAADIALGTGAVTMNPSSGTAVLAFTSATPVIGSLGNSGTGTRFCLSATRSPARPPH